MIDGEVSSLVPGQTGIRIRDVQVAAARVLCVPLWVMTSDRRFQAYTVPRFIAMAVAYELTGRTSFVIGYYFGFRDHSNVYHARARVAALLETDPTLTGKLEAIKLGAAQEAAKFQAWMQAAVARARGHQQETVTPPGDRLGPLLGRAHDVRIVYHPAPERARGSAVA